MELIVFVGLQASGKSTYYRTHFAATHVQVSKDLMKNVRNREERQRRMIESELAAGRSVVVDNTNATPVVRAALIEIGKRRGARVIACYFETTVRDSVSRNRTREGSARVPDVALFAMARTLVPPTVAEGFDEVRVIAKLPGVTA
jgi:predicted kinase